MVTVTVRHFREESPAYSFLRIHSKSLIFLVAGWILHQLYDDVLYGLYMEMAVYMRVVYALWVALEIAAIVGILLSVWKKNELLLIPAAVFLILEIVSCLKEIGIAVWALLFPDSGVPEALGEQFREAHTNTSWFFHGFKVYNPDLPFYSILSLSATPLRLIICLILLLITYKYFTYLRDWRRTKTGKMPTQEPGLDTRFDPIHSHRQRINISDH